MCVCVHIHIYTHIYIYICICIYIYICRLDQRPMWRIRKGQSFHVHSAHLALSRKLLSLPLFFASPSTKWRSDLCGVRHWRASNSTGALRGRRASFAPSPWVRPREPGLSARPSRPPYFTKVKIPNTKNKRWG